METRTNAVVVASLVAEFDASRKVAPVGLRTIRSAHASRLAGTSATTVARLAVAAGLVALVASVVFVFVC